VLKNHSFFKLVSFRIGNQKGSGLPEIGDQSPKSATADLGGGGFPQKIRALKEAGAHFDSA
jgi:hypothetical protein